ncbi:MAG: iron-containing redox enzyme family protein [Alphaproteobacteria bacterium]
MTQTASEQSNVIEIWSDGGYLSQNTVALMAEASKSGPYQVLEHRIADLSPQEIESLGLRAAPSIMINNGIAFEGRPSPEEAALLVKRAEIDRVILEYSVDRSAAMRQFASGGARSNSIALSLAQEFYHLCREFPLFLAAAISHIQDDESRLLLVSNLYEEHGNLDIERLHPALFRQFIRSMGLEPAVIEKVTEGSPGVEAAQAITTICRQGPAVRALATLYAIELWFAPACDMVLEGLRPLALSSEAIKFFVVHSGADIVHSQQLRKALLKVCQTDDEWRTAINTAGEASQMFYTLFDFIASAQLVTTGEELQVYETIKRLCADSPFSASHPVEYKDAVYYFGINVGTPDHWFLRAFCDTRRHSLVTRLPVQQVATLSPGFEVEATPAVFGTSRVYFNSVNDLEKLRALVFSAYEAEVKSQ